MPTDGQNGRPCGEKNGKPPAVVKILKFQHHITIYMCCRHVVKQIFREFLTWTASRSLKVEKAPNLAQKDVRAEKPYECRDEKDDSTK